jgi:hypothetical protein
MRHFLRTLQALMVLWTKFLIYGYCTLACALLNFHFDKGGECLRHLAADQLLLLLCGHIWWAT